MSFYPGVEIECNSECNKEVEAEINLVIDYETDKITVTLNSEQEVLNCFWEDAKNELKRCVYRLLSKRENGRVLPWGTLTGIRPIKLPMALMEQGKTDEQIQNELRDTYYISKEKLDLSIKIAHTEQKLLEKIDVEDGYSLYIGIPFCPTTCLYCSFTSYPFTKYEDKIGDYLHALKKEILYTASKFKGKKLNSIYFGGGTPTTLKPEQLDWLLDLVATNFDLSDCFEWTVEGGRPDSITREKLKVMKNYPVDRISINPQTMKQETLDLIGRRHTVEQFRSAYEMAREEGYTNINMDLILGLPEETTEDVRRTMEEMKLLGPDNLTIHTLALKRAARLTIEKDQYAHLHFEQNTNDMMQITMDVTKEMGLEPYYLYRQKNMSGNLENIGYAKPGLEGVYNILIMEEKQSILALGAGSVTKRVEPDGRITRASNVKNIEQYMERIDEMIDRKEALWNN
ncbi:putative radical SAM family enzyme, NOT coproporphyrinogen III oxidase, oxygen-independent [Lachnospiraceae bacterium TWA4]|nr:putative radical SAM family enzyme, NOT coproporphyrinogen III oxidase, oxygen-independent [Lachnospiraceae bacterium TWA4]